MAVTKDYPNYVLEQLSALRAVTWRRMFGGVGLYCDGLFFGLIDDDVLYLKVDDTNRADYEARNMRQFRPYPDRPEASMSYYEVPADVLEDRDDLAAWARKSVGVASASAQRKAKPRAATQVKSRAAVKARPGAATKMKLRAAVKAKPRSPASSRARTAEKARSRVNTRASGRTKAKRSK